MAFDDGIRTVSGSVAHTDDAATKVPFVSVKCGIEPTLTGVTEIDAVRPDGNILQTVATSKTQNGITWTVNADGSVTLDGTSTARTYLYVHNYHKILPKDATLTVSVEGLKDNGTSDVFVNLPYSDNGTTYSGSYGQVTWGTPKKTISYTADKYIGFYIDCPANVTTNQTIKIMVTIGSEAQTFEPYVSPVTHNVELGRTIYGGTADIANGEGESLCGKIVFDGSETRWAEYATGNGYAIPLTGMKRGTWYTSPLALSSPLPKAPNNDNLGVRIGVNNDGIYVVQANTISGVTDLASFKAWLSENPLTIIYPLDTEIDFTFTPITPTPETVGKVNNVYCNTGDTEVTYYDNAHGFSEVTVNKNGVSQTAYLHKVIYGGQADVVKGTCKPKNLIQLYTRASNNGVDYSINEDGSLHRSGLATANSYNNGNASSYENCPYKFSAGTYTITVSGSTTPSDYVSFGIITKSGTSMSAQNVYGNSSKTFTINEDFGTWYWCKIGSGVTVDDNVYIWLEKGSSSTEYAPYFDPFTFPPISIGTDEGENTLFANEGASAITYRKAVD